MYSILAICAGASGGALSRWLLGLQLNALFPTIPPGTLAANLLGGLFIGVALSFFSAQGSVAPEWRLFIITGFLGGFTTFRRFPLKLLPCYNRAGLPGQPAQYPFTYWGHCS